MRQTRREFVHSALATSVAAALPAAAFSACSISSNAAHTSTFMPSSSPHRTQFDASSEIPFPQKIFLGRGHRRLSDRRRVERRRQGRIDLGPLRAYPGKIKNGDTGDVACDSYHRWQEDIALIRAMNLNSYRFSISWPRIQPSGAGPANSEGVDYYRRLVDALLGGPNPAASHALSLGLAAGSGRCRGLAKSRHGCALCRLCGANVDEPWATAYPIGSLFNEPLAFTYQGYLEGNHAPGRKSLLGFLRAAHTVNLAQACGIQGVKAVVLRRAWAPRSACRRASLRRIRRRQAGCRTRHAITNLWFLDPALKGRYPDALAFLPESAMRIKSGDLDKMRAPLDFIGINLYYRTICSAPGLTERLSHPQQWLFPVKMESGHQGKITDNGWEVWPQAMYDMVMRITRDYNHPQIEITENGCAYSDGPDASGGIRDTRRIQYYRGNLQALARAIADGADVRGYHAWSLLDNFEWAEGFRQRFGLAYVDFKTQRRTYERLGPLVRRSRRISGTVTRDSSLRSG